MNFDWLSVIEDDSNWLKKTNADHHFGGVSKENHKAGLGGIYFQYILFSK